MAGNSLADVAPPYSADLDDLPDLPDLLDLQLAPRSPLTAAYGIPLVAGHGVAAVVALGYCLTATVQAKG